MGSNIKALPSITFTAAAITIDHQILIRLYHHHHQPPGLTHPQLRQTNINRLAETLDTWRGHRVSLNLNHGTPTRYSDSDSAQTTRAHPSTTTSDRYKPVSWNTWHTTTSDQYKPVSWNTWHLARPPGVTELEPWDAHTIQWQRQCPQPQLRQTNINRLAETLDTWTGHRVSLNLNHGTPTRYSDSDSVPSHTHLTKKTTNQRNSRELSKAVHFVVRASFNGTVPV